MNLEAYQVIADERIASIRDVQKNPSKALRGFTRVMRGGKTMGFYLSASEWDEMLEDLEASASTSLKKRVRKARKDLRENRVVSLGQLAKEYGL